MDYPLSQSEKNYGFTTHKRQSSRQPEVKLPDVDFADDVALADNSISESQAHLNDVDQASKKVGLEINVPKTKYQTYNIPGDHVLTVGEKPIEEVDNFKYLGSMSKDSTTDIARRRAIAFSAFYSMNSIWNSSTIPLDLKTKIFKVSVLTVFLYGCETWIINEADKETINSFATICYRKILGIDQVIDHATNEEVLKRVKTTELILHVHRRQLEKTGHRLRKPAGSLANRYALYEPALGQRRPGRPRTTFKEQIANIIDPVTKPTEAQIREYAQDRDAWRRMIKERTSGPK